jgi:radical SAM superfamily enzyme YgiQ (UPF0313 family)
MKLVLAAAPTPGDRHRQAENLGLRYLAACALSAGHDVSVLDGTDSGQSTEDYAERIAALRPDVVGFAVQFAAQALPTAEVAARVHRHIPHAGLIAGGQAVNFAWTDLLELAPDLNAVACFEAELGVVEFLRWWENGRVADPPAGFYVRDGDGVEFSGFAEPIAELDSIPFPFRDSSSKAYGEPNFVMLSSRGCQSSCTFCSSGFFGNRYHSQDRWRPRSVDNVIAEVATLVKEHGAKAISFADDDFLGGKATASSGRERAALFAEGLRRSQLPIAYSIELRADELVAGQEEVGQLVGVGLSHVLIGIDGLTKRDLKLYGKRTTLATVSEAIAQIQAFGMTASYGAILFNPLSDPASLREGIENLEHLGIGKSDHLTNKLQLYRGSPLVSYLEREGAALRWDAELFRYDYDLDDDVERIHSAFRDVAVRVRPVEMMLARANFRLSTGIGVEESAQDRRPLLAAEQRVSESLCLAAGAIVDDEYPKVDAALEKALTEAHSVAARVVPA